MGMNINIVLIWNYISIIQLTNTEKFYMLDIDRSD